MLLRLFLLGLLSSAGFAQTTTPPELVGVGQQVPDPPAGVVVHGDQPDRWPEGKGVLLVFFSSFTPSSLNHLRSIEQLRTGNPGIHVIAVAPDSKQRILSAMAAAGASKLPWPTIIADTEGRWKEAFLTPTERTRLPVAVAIGRDRTILWHGPGIPQGVAPPLALISANRWNGEFYASRITRDARRKEYALRLGAARRRARETGEHEPVLELYDELIDSEPRYSRFQADRFQYLLQEMNRPDLGYAYAEEIAKRFADDYITLNDLAWRIVSRVRIAHRDLDRAQSFADRANALRGYQDYALLDTLARIYWMRGDRAQAIRWQRQSVALAPDSWHGDSARHHLTIYENGVLKPGTLPSRWVSPRQTR